MQDIEMTVKKIELDKARFDAFFFSAVAGL
jgi:hypothetical protein